jgi:hypothetical protein
LAQCAGGHGLFSLGVAGGWLRVGRRGVELVSDGLDVADPGTVGEESIVADAASLEEVR